MERAVPVENRAGLDSAAFARLEQPLRSHTSIKHALDWLLAHVPALTPGDIVTQDEYSHDILVAYPGNLHLVYDST